MPSDCNSKHLAAASVANTGLAARRALTERGRDQLQRSEKKLPIKSAVTLVSGALFPLQRRASCRKRWRGLTIVGWIRGVLPLEEQICKTGGERNLIPVLGHRS